MTLAKLVYVRSPSLIQAMLDQQLRFWPSPITDGVQEGSGLAQKISMLLWVWEKRESALGGGLGVSEEMFLSLSGYLMPPFEAGIENLQPHNHSLDTPDLRFILSSKCTKCSWYSSSVTLTKIKQLMNMNE
ncbi:uncharacterized [Tachysurus ichikawai]